MTKYALLLILFLFLVGLNCYHGHLGNRSLTREGPAVFAARNIKAGTVVTENDFEIRQINAEKIPQSSHYKDSIIIGEKSPYSFEKGQLLSSYEFFPCFEDGPFHIAIASRNLEAGHKLKAEDLDSKVVPYSKRQGIFRNVAIGLITSRPIVKGSVIKPDSEAPGKVRD